MWNQRQLIYFYNFVYKVELTLCARSTYGDTKKSRSYLNNNNNAMKIQNRIQINNFI